MIADTNSAVQFATNVVTGSNGLAGGDTVILGIIIFTLVLLALVWVKAKASVVICVGISIAFMLSFVNPDFIFLFWIALIASAFVLVNGLRKMFTGY